MKICLDNAGEFISCVFHEYCISIGIEVEHPIEHMFMLKLTCRIMNKTSKVGSLLMKANLPMTTVKTPASVPGRTSSNR